MNSSFYLPEIHDWNITSFTQFYVDLEINFTMPINVSINIIKDDLQVEVLHQKLFKSLRSNNYIPLNYTTEQFNVPN